MFIYNMKYTVVSADNHNKFNPDLSSTFRPNGQAVSVLYSSGGMYGIYGYDTVKVRKTVALNPVNPVNPDAIKLSICHQM